KRQPRLLGERTEPFTVVADESPQRPLRQLELDQRNGSIGPGAGFDQPFQLAFCGGALRGGAVAGCGGAIPHPFSAGRLVATKQAVQSIEALLVLVWIEQHGTPHRAGAESTARSKHGQNAIKNRDEYGACSIGCS